jgi:hypothetical protein
MLTVSRLYRLQVKERKSKEKAKQKEAKNKELSRA